MGQARGLAGFFSHTAPKLAALARMGVIDDWPDLDFGAEGEPRRRDAPLPVTAFAPNTSWQPFPDGFVALIGKASVWLIDELGPTLLDSLEAVLAAPSDRRDGTRLSNVSLNQRRCAALQQWTAEHFQGPKHFPIQFQVTARPQSGATFLLSSWPPPTWRALRRIVMHLQTAHLVIVALATAARDSELMHLQRDCLRTVASQDLLLGHTCKLSDRPDGEARNWPLPQIAVSAIRQQQRLADILAPGRPSLWLSFKSHDGSDQFPDLAVLGPVLQSFVRGVIVDGRSLEDCSDGNVHPHRFRKTVARLAALSIVGATPIMFDILGHRDPEMTLNYILSDPGLQDEIRKIASEANIVLSREAIERSSENGGRAASLVQDLRLRLAARSGEAELGVGSLAEAAEILSMNGQVTMVRPGVLCTKSLGQRGPCTKKAGLPDVGNCSTDCQHRLELAAAIDDCTKAIERILVEMPPPDNTMMRGWWQAQLAGQLQRFPQIRQRYLAEERVQLALAGLDASTVGSQIGFLEESVQESDA
jgi:integrase